MNPGFIKPLIPVEEVFAIDGNALVLVDASSGPDSFANYRTAHLKDAVLLTQMKTWPVKQLILRWAEGILCLLLVTLPAFLVGWALVLIPMWWYMIINREQIWLRVSGGC